MLYDWLGLNYRFPLQAIFAIYFLPEETLYEPCFVVGSGIQLRSVVLIVDRDVI